jgi:hypothetical protein
MKGGTAMRSKALPVMSCLLAAALLAGTAFCAEGEEEKEKEKERPPRPRRFERGWAPRGEKPGPQGEKDAPGRMGVQGRGQMLRRIMERLKEQDPERYEELMRLREENPGLMHERLKEFGKKLGERRMGKAQDPELREKFKELMALEKKAREFAGQYRKAETEEEKKRAGGDLKSVLVKAFDLKLVTQEKGVQQLEKRLKELKELLEKRKAAREEIIQNRFDELTGKKKHLEW